MALELVGNLFGEQIAFKALNENTKEMKIIGPEKTDMATSTTFFRFCIKSRLIYERIRARSEI